MGKQKKKRGGGRKLGDGQNGEAGEGAPENEDKRIFVGNLAWTTNQQGLKDHFSQCGEIAQADVFTERSGRSRGCGIVEFVTAEMAKNAMVAMNNSELDGRTMTNHLQQYFERNKYSYVTNNHLFDGKKLSE